MIQAGQITFNETTGLSPPLASLWDPPKSQPLTHKFEGDKNKLMDTLVASKTPAILLKISAIFPLDLFPDTVTIDQDKVNIICRNILGMEQVSSVLIENISHVDVQTGIFTATLNIIDSTNMRNPIYIHAHFLNIKDALKARSLIQGLITAKKHKINISEITPLEYASEVEKLGIAEYKEIMDKNPTLSEGKIPHYYGDIIRAIFFLTGLIMLIGLPFFYNLIPFPTAFSVVAIFILALQAGIVNPRSILVAYVNVIIALSGFIIFEYIAITNFVEGVNTIFATVNQLVALLLFIAIYYSTKTLRGFFYRN